jgi:hypothetical protein
VPDVWRGRASWEAAFLGEDGLPVRFSAATHGNAADATAILGRWTTIEVFVRANRSVEFRADGRVVWAPSERLHPRVLGRQRIVLSGMGRNGAGRTFVDGVRWTGMRGSVGFLRTRPAVPRRSVELDFARERWVAQGRSEETGWVSETATRGVLVAARPGVAQRIVSAEGFSPQTTAVFRAELPGEMRLEMGGRVVLGLEDRGAGAPRVLGVEFCGGRVYLHDSSRGAGRVREIATFRPGEIAEAVVEIGSNGVVGVRSGSSPTAFHRPDPLVTGPVHVVLEVSGSSEGVWVQPVGVSTATSRSSQP